MEYLNTISIATITKIFTIIFSILMFLSLPSDLIIMLIASELHLLWLVSLLALYTISIVIFLISPFRIDKRIIIQKTYFLAHTIIISILSYICILLYQSGFHINFKEIDKEIPAPDTACIIHFTMNIIVILFAIYQLITLKSHKAIII